MSDAQWAVLEPLLPRLVGKPRVDDRRVISGILHRYREGLCWRAVPAAYGPRTTLFNRFDRWSKKGIWQGLLAALVACEDPPDSAMVDSTAVRAHRSAAGAKGGSRTKPSDGRALLASVPAMRQLIADKAYDANDLRDFLAGQSTEPVISPMPRRLERPAFDKGAYRTRNLIERAFCRLKGWRAIATRYDKTARNFLAGICLAVAITDWLH